MSHQPSAIVAKTDNAQHPFLILIENALKRGDAHNPDIDLGNISYEASCLIMKYLTEIESRTKNLEKNFKELLKVI